MSTLFKTKIGFFNMADIASEKAILGSILMVADVCKGICLYMKQK